MLKSEMLSNIEKYLKEAKLYTLLTVVKGVDVLKVTLTGLGDKREGSALAEINFIDFEELGDPVLQMFTTVALNLDKDNLIPCERELNDYNLRYVAIGAFHVYEPYRQIYHRYTQPLCGESADMELQAIGMVNAVATQISACYDDILAYAEDAS